MPSKLQATVPSVAVTSAKTVTRATSRTVAANRPATPRASSPAPTKPVPKATRSLAGLFAALSDPRSLQILGSLSNGLPCSLTSLTSTLGIEPEECSVCLGRLKSQRLIEGIRVEGSKGWSYRITEAGSATWGRAQTFGAAQG